MRASEYHKLCNKFIFSLRPGADWLGMIFEYSHDGGYMTNFFSLNYFARIILAVLLPAGALHAENSEWGFMADGMGSYLPVPIIADAHVNELSTKYSSLRHRSNVALPAEFNEVIEFLYQYIKANSAPDAEQANGLSHSELAKMIVEASFCFGTDPFMIAAKIRRETGFKRDGVSSGGAVGFSQMTGAGIEEVQHQMSGNNNISTEGADVVFQRGIECLIGPSQFDYSAGDRITVQNKIRTHPYVDLIFGQILMKTYVSYTKTTTAGLNKDAYRIAFAKYNGDTQMVPGRCMKKRVQMKFEYACDVMTFYNHMNASWIAANTR